MKSILIDNNKTLQRLNNEGLVIWPCMINNSKGLKFKYVETVNDDWDFTDSKGNKYHLKYHSGCFMPYVYQIYEKD